MEQRDRDINAVLHCDALHVYSKVYNIQLMLVEAKISLDCTKSMVPQLKYTFILKLQTGP